MFNIISLIHLNKLSVQIFSFSAVSNSKYIVQALLAVKCNIVDRRAAEVAGNREYHLLLVQDTTVDWRRYNMPVADEIAVLIDGTADNGTKCRDIILQHRSGTLQRIHDTSPFYQAFYYVLLFPRGEHRWTYDIPKQSVGRRCQESPLSQQGSSKVAASRILWRQAFCLVAEQGRRIVVEEQVTDSKPQRELWRKTWIKQTRQAKAQNTLQQGKRI